MRFILLLEERLSVFFADRLITVNMLIMKDFQKRLSGRDFFLLHNSPDMTSLVVNRSEKVLKKTSDLKKEFKIIHHGNILERSGLDRVLPVLTKLNNNKKDTIFKLQVHGKGPFYSRVREKAAEIGVDDYCEFFGEFTHETISPFLGRADCGVVLPHRNRLFDYALPNKFLEYIAAKIPLVSQRLTTLEYYFPEDCVFYVDSDADIFQKILEIANSPELAKEKANKAYEKMLNISWENESKKYLSFIKELT